MWRQNVASLAAAQSSVLGRTWWTREMRKPSTSAENVIGRSERRAKLGTDLPWEARDCGCCGHTDNPLTERSQDDDNVPGFSLNRAENTQFRAGEITLYLADYYFAIELREVPPLHCRRWLMTEHLLFDDHGPWSWAAEVRNCWVDGQDVRAVYPPVRNLSTWIGKIVDQSGVAVYLPAPEIRDQPPRHLIEHAWRTAQPPPLYKITAVPLVYGWQGGVIRTNAGPQESRLAWSAPLTDSKMQALAWCRAWIETQEQGENR